MSTHERIRDFIAKWEAQGYADGLPDEAPSKLEANGKAPSYRRICKAILSNDLHCASLGYSRPNSEAYGAIKRAEIEQREKKMNVYDAANLRLKKIFNEFDNVYVSFSGGKDSGVLLNLAAEYVKKNYPGRKLGVFHIDYEAQYQMTTDYVDAVMNEHSDVLEMYRVCLPVSVPCATSAYQNHWVPWEASKRELWVRDMPVKSINEMNHEFDWFVHGMWDYDLQEKFSAWIHQKKKAERTACLVGIRTEESMNRWRAIHSDRNKNKYNGEAWTLEMSKDVYNAYPIFDWKVDDIWIANAQRNWTYNKLYDLYWMAGLTPHQMRVASPFIEQGMESLKLYRVIDPNNWGRMIGRVNGVNFAGLYGGTTAMGWRNIKLPTGHTWKSYMNFLLSTLPEEASESYKKKLLKSEIFWKETGGCLSQETISKLKGLDIPHEVVGLSNRNTDKPMVRMEYQDDVDVEEFRELPTYKRMCVCIMKNDHLCKFMGFSLTKTETLMRSEASKKYERLVHEKSVQVASL